MVSRQAVLFLLAGVLVAAPLAAKASPPAAPALRDGSHDFDFERGTWKIHIHRLLHPLAGRNDWADYDGTKADIPIWGGKANVAEVQADGPAGHLNFIALRLYDPASHQWNLNFASAGGGAFGTPLYGEMRNGTLEFVGTDTLNGRNILVRFTMSAEAPGKASSRQYFSADGGRSWELNWINRYTRTEG